MQQSEVAVIRPETVAIEIRVSRFTLIPRYKLLELHRKIEEKKKWAIEHGYYVIESYEDITGEYVYEFKKI